MPQSHGYVTRGLTALTCRGSDTIERIAFVERGWIENRRRLSSMIDA